MNFSTASRHVKAMLAWDRLYRVASYLKSALWLVPFVAILLELVATRVLHALDRWVKWDLFGLDTSGAQGLFQTVVTLTLSFVIFTFGSLLVAIQVASAQLTPRIIATTLLRDRVVRYTVGLNVFTLLLAVSALNRLGTTVPQLVVAVTGVLGVACLASFLFLIDHAARLLRPVQIVALVGDQGLDVIRSVYPELKPDLPGVPLPMRMTLGEPQRLVNHWGRSHIVVAVQLELLVTAARRVDGIIEFVPHVGDFVAADEPLFRLYGGAGAIDDHTLRACVAFGAERTIEQDPMFAFRILVDIAIKALSPAINDPTTAVLCIDQIHRLLRTVGLHLLRGEEVLDEAGRCRVLFQTPNWEDFVNLACTEIRACGANNMQIARRLGAMLQNLIRTLPGLRHAALREQLSLLDRVIESAYALPEERALARIPDAQGLGASSSSGPAS